MKKTLDLLLIKIFNKFYDFQEKNHKNRMQKLNKTLLSGNICGQKHVAINGATLSINNENSKNDKANQEKIEKIIEQYINEPKKLFDYIKGAKTPVYKIKYAKKILSFINEQEGFILPKKGLEAFYLNLILNKKIAFSTPEMFILSSYDVNVYAFIYQFYNWYCYKMKLSGFEIKTQEQFKHVFEICETSKINELSFSEILGLKSAIRRDIEAIEFVQQFAKKKTMAQKNLEKIKQGKAIKV